jgi:biopolymer transport protein ExbB
MHFDLIKIFHEMDWMARGVTFVLFAMGIISLAVAFERMVAYGRSTRQSASLSGRAAGLIAQRDYEKLLGEAQQYSASHLSRMLVPVLRIYLQHEWQVVDKPAVVVEVVRRELARKLEESSTDLRKGLSVLASVGSVAPFVGLLGTVVGIIAAFGKISLTGSGGLSSVAGGISEALIVTALGLLIAIPAVLIFNALTTRADKIQQGIVMSGGEFMDHLEFSQQLLEEAPPVEPHHRAVENGNGPHEAGLERRDGRQIAVS